MSVSQSRAITSHITQQINLLKAQFTSFQNLICFTLKHYDKSIKHDLQLLISQLMNEVKTQQNRSKELQKMIDSLYEERNDEKEHFQLRIGLLQREGEIYKKQALQFQKKYQQMSETNRKCEEQFLNLIQEMKQVKETVQHCNIESLPPELSLTKMSSQENLEQRASSQYLETIKEVTQQSIHSEEHQIPSDNESITEQTSSFQCTAEVMDISKMILEEVEENSGCESVMDSLRVLKNYNKDEVCPHGREEKGVVVNLPTLEELRMPMLRFVEQQGSHKIAFENNFQYVGRTKPSSGDKSILQPDGFGRLLRGEKVVYCGEWRDGVWEGWGKVTSFPEPSTLLQISGSFKKGVLEGSGKVLYTDGSQFMGSFTNNQIAGFGTYLSENQHHRGHWQSNYLHKKL